MRRRVQQVDQLEDPPCVRRRWILNRKYFPGEIRGISSKDLPQILVVKPSDEIFKFLRQATQIHQRPIGRSIWPSIGWSGWVA